MEGTPTPPPSYASYPRVGDMHMYGTSEKLRRLYRGYKGTTYTFLLGILSYFLIIPGSVFVNQPGMETIGYVLYVLPVAGVIGLFYMSIRTGMDIAYGNGWPVAVGVIVGIVTPFMCLIICAIMGFITSTELKRYGLTSQFFKGFDKAVVDATIERLRQYEQGVANQTQPVQSANFNV